MSSAQSLAPALLFNSPLGPRAPRSAQTLQGLHRPLHVPRGSETFVRTRLRKPQISSSTLWSTQKLERFSKRQLLSQIHLILNKPQDRCCWKAHSHILHNTLTILAQLEAGYSRHLACWVGSCFCSSSTSLPIEASQSEVHFWHTAHPNALARQSYCDSSWLGLCPADHIPIRGIKL